MSSNNGQKYYVATEKLRVFFGSEHCGESYSDIGRLADLGAKTVASILKGDECRRKSILSVYKAFRSLGYSGSLEESIKVVGED